MATFTALADLAQDAPLIVVDIGYSTKKKSCGIAWSGGSSCCARFGACVDRVVDLLTERRDQQQVLVIEAPLSTCHDRSGNPCLRGQFESGRAWYCGAGAIVTLAAMRFIEQISNRVTDVDRTILLAEAFLSHKQKGPSRHADDASIIFRNFWVDHPEDMDDAVAPLHGIRNVPPVRVFRESRQEAR